MVAARDQHKLMAWQHSPPSPPPTASLRGLDGVNLFLANVQTGFGPFVAVYLTSQHWTQTEIGLILSIGTITMILSQLPAGAIVDAVTGKKRLVAGAIGGVASAAMIIALWPVFLPIAIAKVVHAFSSCILTPGLTAISVGLVGHEHIGARLGRNARFASIGSGLAAAVMGICGTYFSTRAVFFLTAILAIPALVSLFAIHKYSPSRSRFYQISYVDRAAKPSRMSNPLSLFRDRRVLAFALCCALFHLSNAAMLPLAGAMVTETAAASASMLVAACIVVPQIVVALLSPAVGHRADLWGRRPVMLLGFAALPIRGFLLATLPDPYLIVIIQIFDGISGAMFGVMLPLVSADLTRGTGRLNLCIGLMGLSVGVGATLSTTLAGLLADHLGDRMAFIGLGLAGLVAVIIVLVLMGEPRDQKVAAVEA